MGNSTVINFDGVMKLKIGTASEEVVKALKEVIKDSCILDNTKNNVVFRNYNGFNGFVADVISLLKKALSSPRLFTYPNGESQDYCPTFWMYSFDCKLDTDIEVFMGEEIPLTRFKNNRKMHREMELRGARNIYFDYEEYVEIGDDDYEMQKRTFNSIENILDFKSFFRKRYDEVHRIDSDKYKRGRSPSQRFSISANDNYFDGTYSLLKKHKLNTKNKQFAKSLLSFYDDAFHVEITKGKKCIGFNVYVDNRKKRQTIHTEKTNLNPMQLINGELSDKKISRISKINLDGIMLGWNKKSAFFVFKDDILTEAKMQKALQALIKKHRLAKKRSKND